MPKAPFPLNGAFMSLRVAMRMRLLETRCYGAGCGQSQNLLQLQATASQFKLLQHLHILPPQESDRGENMLCASCQRNLTEGMDVLGVQEGVVGPRGFVPLEEILLLCSEECLRTYFADPSGDVERVP